MKPPPLKNLVPIHEFRQHLASWLEHLERSQESVVLTQRGKAIAVVISPERYEELLEEKELIRVILKGLRELEAGEVVSHDEVKQKLAVRRLRSAEKRGAELE